MRIVSVLIGFTWAFVTLAPAAQAENYLGQSMADESAEQIINAPGDYCESGDCMPEPYECCDCFNDRKRFLGLLPSDHCFDRFISPISNPFFFEDPRSLTEARGIFIENSLPNSIGGGDLQVWSGQLRGRLTDRVSIIAPRLGYLQVNQPRRRRRQTGLCQPRSASNTTSSVTSNGNYWFLAASRTSLMVPGMQCRTSVTVISTYS